MGRGWTSRSSVLGDVLSGSDPANCEPPFLSRTSASLDLTGSVSQAFEGALGGSDLAESRAAPGLHRVTAALPLWACLQYV